MYCFIPLEPCFASFQTNLNAFKFSATLVSKKASINGDNCNSPNVVPSKFNLYFIAAGAPKRLI